MKTEAKYQINRYEKWLETVRSGTGIDIFEKPESKEARIERAKYDVAFFVEYYLPHYCTRDDGSIIKSAPFHLEFADFVRYDKRIKIFAEWGRAQAKSVWSTVIVPLWLWANNDIKYMVVIGNNYDKAKILLSDLQAEFEANERLLHDFGNQKRIGTWEDGYFQTQSGFAAKAVGMGQDARGLRLKKNRPDYIVADDLEDQDTVKNPKRQRETAKWILTSIIPTMDGARARFVFAGNRFAPKMIQTELKENCPDWTVHRVDAYDPVTYKPAWEAKYDNDYFKTVETEIGRLNALAEYCNTPHVKGSYFTESMITWDAMPDLKDFKAIVGHWDVAFAGTKTSDYNAVRIWGLHNDIFWFIGGFVKQTKVKPAVEFAADYQKRLPKNAHIHWRFEAQFYNDEINRTIKEVEEQTDISINFSKVATPKKPDKLNRI